MKKIPVDTINSIKNSIDVYSLLSNYGAKQVTDSYGDIRSECVLHGGNNPTSLVYSKSKKKFKCFACGFSGDIIEFVIRKENIQFAEAIKLLARMAGIQISYTESSLPYDVNPNDKKFMQLSRIYKVAHRPAPEAIDDKFVKRCQECKTHPYLTSRNFNEETLRYFGLGFCDFSDAYKNRVIIPIYNEKGELIGYSGRAVEDTDKTSKYRLKQGFVKASALYNIHNAVSALAGRKKELILCEGFAQVWRLHEAGIDNAVALMGRLISDEQIDLICKYALYVVLAMDFDQEGVKATYDLIKKLKSLVKLKVLWSPHDEVRDLGDMSTEEVLELFKTCILSPAEWHGNQVSRQASR